MSQKNRCLLIDHLSLFHAIYLLVRSYRYDMIYYVHRGNFGNKIISWIEKVPSLRHKIKKINYVDVPGSAYESMEEATQNVNDILFDTYNNNFFVKIALALAGNDDYTVVLRKELLVRYVEKRVKTLVLLKYLIATHNHCVFSPYDNEAILQWISPINQPVHGFGIPLGVKVKNSITGSIKKVGAWLLFPLFLMLIVFKFLLRGITIKKITSRCYDFGLDVQRSGLVGERGLDKETKKFFLYDDDRFRPSNIIHMVRNAQKLDTEGKDSFTQFGCPYIELDTLKVPGKFFFDQVFSRFFIRSLLNSIKFSFGTNKNPIFLVPALALINMVLTARLNNEYYSVKVFIGRDEYDPYHIVRTLVARERGNKTIGFQWAESHFHSTAFNYITYDVYALWGTYYQNLQKKALENSRTECIGAGIYGSDITFQSIQDQYLPEPYKEIKKTYRIVAIISSGYEPDSSIEKGPAVQYIEDLLRSTDQYKKVFRVIKPKGDMLVQEIREVIKGRERVLLETELTTPRFISIPDVIIVQGLSSLFAESLMAGKKVLSYSLVVPKKFHIYAPYSPFFAAFSKDELDEQLRQILVENSYADTSIVDDIRFRHGYAFDGHVVDRFRKLCLELLNS